MAVYGNGACTMELNERKVGVPSSGHGYADGHGSGNDRFFELSRFARSVCTSAG